MGLLKSINVSLTDGQLIKLANGKRILLKHEQVRDDGCHCLKLKSRKHTRVTKHKAQGKGTRLQLDDDEMEGTGLWDWLKEKGAQAGKYVIQTALAKLDVFGILPLLTIVFETDNLIELFKQLLKLDGKFQVFIDNIEYVQKIIKDAIQKVIDKLKELWATVVSKFKEITGGADDVPASTGWLEKIAKLISDWVIEPIASVFKWVFTKIYKYIYKVENVDEKGEKIINIASTVFAYLVIVVFIGFIWYKFAYNTPLADAIRRGAHTSLQTIGNTFITGIPYLPRNVKNGLKSILLWIIDWVFGPDGIITKYFLQDNATADKATNKRYNRTAVDTPYGPEAGTKEITPKPYTPSTNEAISKPYSQDMSTQVNTQADVTRAVRNVNVQGKVATPRNINAGQGLKSHKRIKTMSGSSEILTWKEHFGAGMRGKKFASRAAANEHVRKLSAEWKGKVGAVRGGSSEILLSPGLGSTAPKIIKKKKGRA